MDIDALLAARLRTLRKARGHTLDQLAQRSGVSRSAISQIERGEISPTAAVLGKLAAALGLPLATLFDMAPASAAPSPLVRHAAQPCWQDPASGYLRRHLTPAGHGGQLELTEVVFPAGQSVTFDNAMHTSDAPQQQLWLLEGQMTLTVGTQCWQLQAGDCLAMAVNQAIVFANPASTPARYVLALSSASSSTSSSFTSTPS